MKKKVEVHPSWLVPLQSEFDKPYMQGLRAFLLGEKSAGRTIYPEGKNIFNALNSTPLDNVKVVILGQDPYHGPKQAHGLAFSVLPGVDIPPSLRNMYKELGSDVGFIAPTHGCLQNWAAQGVLLLNATLTVEARKAGSHQGKGWELFTDAVIHAVNDYCEGVVFLLWGSYAQKKCAFIDANKHHILMAPHPSPLSAYRGFFGCKNFSQANDILVKNNKAPINWQLPS
ncbi:MAG: uracil-DNA glycosylase [Marinagarivorans sp.]|nr:uracil-DNA glycosylase [Marinagarivorans sp.]